jgi:hypothetical protein
LIAAPSIFREAQQRSNQVRYRSVSVCRGEKGFDADFAVLDGDPMTDVGNLAKVAYTIRAGQVIYRK